MFALSAKLNLHRPSTKYVDVEKDNLSYRKQRRHTKVQTRKLTRCLLYLIGKILKETRMLLERKNAGAEKLLTAGQKSDVEIISRMNRQQRNHFENNDPRESVKDRIVGISTPYAKPILRDKKVMSVELIAKCNNILVDGLSLIEKVSFNAFNEGTRLQHCLKMHRMLFGVDAKKVGGGAGYVVTPIGSTAGREGYRHHS